MAGKRTKTRKKIKLNKKLVCTIGVLLLIIAVIFAIIMIFKPCLLYTSDAADE